MKARDNPFAVERIAAVRYRLLDTTFDQLLVHLHELNYRAAIVGPQGSGKTTLLEDLRPLLAGKGIGTRLVFVNDTAQFDSPACRQLLAELSRDEILLLDGADLIRRGDWSLLKRHTITHTYGVIITSHRVGLLRTLIECRTTPALLREIVAALRPDDPLLTPAFLDNLYTRHQGNLRNCLRELYDFYAQREKPNSKSEIPNPKHTASGRSIQNPKHE